LRLLGNNLRFIHTADKFAAHFFQRPSAGEEENAEADEAERAVELVEDVAEVKPEDGNCKTDDAQIDQCLRGVTYTPPDDEDAEGGDEYLRGK